jgi:beta-lactamase class A
MGQVGFGFFFGAATIAGLGLGWGARELERATPAVPVARAEARTERLGGYAFVRPLLECEPGVVRDPARFDGLRPTLDALADRVRAGGIRVAIHLRDLDSAEALDVGAGERFAAAPTVRLPLAMTALRATEHGPATPAARPDGPSMDVLIDRALVDADEDAARSIARAVPPEALRRTYADLGLTPPEAQGDTVTARDVAMPFRYLYNATYLGGIGSERVLAALGRAAFRDGLVAGVPASVPVAHEAGEGAGELHDCGIVYAPGHPYLLCVLAAGPSRPALIDAVRGVSEAVYAHYARQPVAMASR